MQPENCSLLFVSNNQVETKAQRQQCCGSIFFYICSIASHRTLLLSLSMSLQQFCWQRKQKEKRFKKRVRSGLKNGPGIRTRFWAASEYWHISRGLRKRSHFGACILVLANHFRAHFWNRTIMDAERPFLSATCSRRTPKCSHLMLALNTYSFQTIKLKLAAFLPSAAPTVQLREYLFLHLFDCKPQNIVAVVVHESATAQEAVLLDGVAA